MIVARTGRRGQFVRYIVAGLVNTAATYALLVMVMQWVEYLLAYTLVYAVGIVLGYWLQSRFVFRVARDWRTAAKFPLVYVTQYALGAIVLWLFIDLAGVARQWAALAVVATTVPFGFLLSRLIFLARGRESTP